VQNNFLPKHQIKQAKVMYLLGKLNHALQLHKTKLEAACPTQNMLLAALKLMTKSIKTRLTRVIACRLSLQ
jgi:hypothetical protein|tara:strand:+ start:722 stop:934 length:213 start_codon:yes stop_codon:yes gene_type:complete